MYVGDQFLKFVVFLGYPDAKALGNFSPIGTGFLLVWDEAGYLVTARHVAEILGKDPFSLRINRTGSGNDAALFHADDVSWFYPEDETIDVAVTPLHIGNEEKLDHLYIAPSMVLTDEENKNVQVGVETIATR